MLLILYVFKNFFVTLVKKAKIFCLLENFKQEHGYHTTLFIKKKIID